ncbi:MAG: nucleotidyltransferase domain-containing protein [Spirochaetia bacterium]
MAEALHLNEVENKIVKLFSEKIRNDFPETVVAVYLFGSKARGDSTRESDIDLLVLINRDDWHLANQIRRVGYQIDSEIDYKLSIIVIPEERFSFMKKNKYSFAENIINEGVAV